MVISRLEVDDRCPRKLEYIDNFVTSAVNAAVICTGLRWEDIVKSLIDQVHIRAYMPAYTTCVTDMLRVNGFVSMPNVTRIQEIPGAFGEEGAASTKYILKVRYYGYCAMVPDANNDGYRVKGIRKTEGNPAHFFLEACWKYVPGTDNRTGIKRDGFAMPGRTEAHKSLAVKNMNPKDHNIGDCAVRGLCAALECSWDEAIDLLIKASRYIDPIINSLSNINNALIGLGFERHKAIRRDRKLLTGKQFCEQMTYTFHNGERIFAYVGKNHCAAVLPFKEADGSVRYKAQDTWDSTDKKIGDFWVIPPKWRRELGETKASVDPCSDSDLNIGSTIRHPMFGQGVITGENGDILTVAFTNVGVKRVSKKWLLNFEQKHISQ